ncbi:MAG: NIPSNAP family protein [Terriglobia bacterium]
MKILISIFILIAAAMSAQTPSHVFELRTYHASAGRLEDLKTRFRDHTIEIFNRHHMKSVGYWIPQDNKDYVLIYILEFPSRADADKAWAAFQADPDWVKVKTASEANGKIVDKVDRVFMDPADFSPMK